MQEGIDLLVDLQYLGASSVSTFTRGGRLTTTYTANPGGWHDIDLPTFKTLKTPVIRVGTNDEYASFPT